MCWGTLLNWPHDLLYIEIYGSTNNDRLKLGPLEGDIFPIEVIKQIQIESFLDTGHRRHFISLPFKIILVILLYCKWMVCRQRCSLISFNFNVKLKKIKSLKDRKLSNYAQKWEGHRICDTFPPPEQYNSCHLLS